MPFFHPNLLPARLSRDASAALVPASHVRMQHPFRGSRFGSRLCAAAALVMLFAFTPSSRAEAGSSSSLPEAPTPQAAAFTAQNGQKTGPGRVNKVFGIYVGPAYPIKPDSKWDISINAGQHPEPLSPTDTLIYAAHEQVLPVVIVPGLLSAGWGQMVDANPHVGTDAGGFGERLGYAMLRQASDRLTGDGIFAAAFRQDPRFYRENNGPIVHRGLRAVRQTFMRYNGDGDGGSRVNASGILGHALGNYLAMAYYPDSSSGAGVATSGFATSIAGDMGVKLIQEFAPDLLGLVFRRNQ